VNPFSGLSNIKRKTANVILVWATSGRSDPVSNWRSTAEPPHITRICKKILLHIEPKTIWKQVFVARWNSCWPNFHLVFNVLAFLGAVAFRLVENVCKVTSNSSQFIVKIRKNVFQCENSYSALFSNNVFNVFVSIPRVTCSFHSLNFTTAKNGNDWKRFIKIHSNLWIRLTWMFVESVAQVLLTVQCFMQRADRSVTRHVYKLATANI